MLARKSHSLTVCHVFVHLQNKDADRLAFAIGGAASHYPAEGEDGTAVVAYMGFPTLQQARGCTEVANMRQLVTSFLILFPHLQA